MIFDAEAIMDAAPRANQRAFRRTIYRPDVDGQRRKPMIQAVCKPCEWEGDARVKGSRFPVRQMIEHNRAHHGGGVS